MSALLLAALAVSPWCQSVSTVARATIEARDAGVPRTVIEQAAETLQDPDARRAAHAVAWYVYEANADRRTPPAQLLLLIRGACSTDAPNALRGIP